MFLMREYSSEEKLAAVTRRDQFFDHFFYQGIVTTGIYCRTDCPAKLPLAKNIRFFSSLEEAENAGFRACKRCKPEAKKSYQLTVVPESKRHNNDSVFHFLAFRTVKGLEESTAEYYARSLRVNGRSLVLSIHKTTTGKGLYVRSWGNISDSEMQDLIKRMFDYDAPIKEIRKHLLGNPLLKKIVTNSPVPSLPVYSDPFEGIVRVIVGQLISVKAARTILARLIENFGEKLPRPISTITHVFPTAEDLSKVDIKDLTHIGLTTNKAISIINVANKICNKELDSLLLSELDSTTADQILQNLPGIGPWTSACIRMEVLRDRNAFPAKDLGIIKALKNLMKASEITQQQLTQLHQSWSPWGAYATLYLWRHLDFIEQVNKKESK